MNLLALVLALAAPQNALESMEARTYTGASGGTLKYRLFTPKVEERKAPLVLFLHGAGERGSDNVKQIKHGVPDFLKRQKDYPCIVVAPQCPAKIQWVDTPWGAPSHRMPGNPTEPMALAIELVESLIKDLAVDPDRVYVTGLSMGGFGTWDIVSRKPGLFAAAAPICGGGDETQAPKIAGVPQWIFHGGNDKVVLTSRSRNMVEALKKAGGDPIYSEFPGVGHFSWNRAYRNPKFFAWLFSQTRKKASR